MELKTKPWFGLRMLIGALLACGFLARAVPLANPGGRLLWQFPTEDGYLMLTIARNIALGNGMSTAGGTIPTNGTQPLTTLLYAAGYSAVGADKTQGVLAALVIQLLISVVAVAALYRLGTVVFQSQHAGAIAALAAAIWYSSPKIVSHSMNCLETGAYLLVVILVIYGFVRHELREPKTNRIRWALGYGLLLGVAFWVRNDASLLIAALCVSLIALGIGRGIRELKTRFVQAIVMGAVSVVVALPWLYYNYTRFGSIMPISGQAEAHGERKNLGLLPAVLAEYILLVPVPQPLERHPATIALGLLVIVAAVAAIIIAYWRGSIAVRAVILPMSLFAAGICVFYGFFFSAPHFVTRYMSPLSPFLALLWAWVGYQLWQWARLRVGMAAMALPIGLLAFMLTLNARIYRSGNRHMHAHVVQWVKQNVAEDEWVGEVVKTGTLGYFHDRTVNLDGKVNPEALKRKRKGEIPDYIVERQLAYVVDWAGVAKWAEIPVLKQHYELLVSDQKQNLAVLKRR